MRKILPLYFLLFSCFQLLAVTVLPIDALTLRIAHAGLLLASAFLIAFERRPHALKLAR